MRSREIDSLYTLASGRADDWQVAYDLVWEQQIRSLREALGALVQSDVRVLTFKGGELVARHFGEHSIGLSGDVDLLVPRDQVDLAKSVLYGLGYRHLFFDQSHRVLRERDIREVAEIELHHYELAPFIKAVDLELHPEVLKIATAYDAHPICMLAGRPVALISIDVHHNVASDADPDVFFDRAVPSYFGVGETFSSADHVWLNLSRYYNEVALHDRHSLRPFAYTLPELSTACVDWDVVENAASELHLGPTLYYFLSLCHRLLPDHVPKSTLATVLQSTSSQVRDWGWQLGKLFGFQEEFPGYAFDSADA